MKKLLFTFAFILVALGANAIDFEVGTCKYTTTGTDEATGLKTVSCKGMSTTYASSNEVRIPSSVTYNGEWYYVKSINNGAFNANKNLTTVVIGRGVETISSSAFAACTNLKEVYLPSTLSSIGNSAFLNCGNSLVIYGAWINKLPTMGENAFSRTTVTNIYVPTIPGKEFVLNDATLKALNATVTVDPSKANDGYQIYNSKNYYYVVTKMPTSAAQGELALVGTNSTEVRTIGLSSVPFANLPNGSSRDFYFTSIAPFAFYNSQQITRVANISNVTIGEQAFFMCSKLTQVTIRSGVIKESAFAGCSSLSSVTLGHETDSYNLIAENSSFINIDCKSITIKKNVTRLGSVGYPPGLVFYSLALESITVASDNPNYSSYNGMLYDKEQTVLHYVPTNTPYTSLNKSNLAPNLLTIGSYALKDNKSVTQFIIPYGVKTISGWACSGAASLANVSIPSSVAFIDTEAFGSSGITKISAAWLDGSYLPKFGDNVFRNLVGFTITLPTKGAVESDISSNITLKVCTPTYVVDPATANDVYSDADATKYAFVVTKAPTASADGRMTLVGANFNGGTMAINIDDTKMAAISRLPMRGTAVTRPIYCNEVAPYAFNEKTSLTNLQLSYTTEKTGVERLKIGDYAFYGCNRLANVSLGLRVDSIGEYSFYNTFKLTSFPFDDENLKHLKFLGRWAFCSSGLTGDITLTLEFGNMQEQVFTNCKSLNSLTVYDATLKTILTPYTEKYVPFWMNNMNSNFRLYLPLRTFYNTIATCYSNMNTTADKVMPFICSGKKYMPVCFPRIRDNNGTPPESKQFVSLCYLYKEGGKIYRAGCKALNPVSSDGKVDLVEVVIPSTNDYYYSAPYEDEGLILQLEPNKIYRLDRISTANMTGDGFQSYQYNILRATATTSQTDGSLVRNTLPGASGDVYVNNVTSTDNLSDLVYLKQSTDVAAPLYLSAYVDLAYVVQSPIPSVVMFNTTNPYDLNGDGKVSTADIQIIINEMKKPQASQNMAYDLNGDGKISTADIQVIINEMKK